MSASDTIKQPVARYQAVSIRRSTPQQLPCPVIPLAVARIDKMVSDPILSCLPSVFNLGSWTPVVLAWLFLLLLPFGRSSELPMFIMAVLGGVLIWKHGRQCEKAGENIPHNKTNGR